MNQPMALAQKTFIIRILNGPDRGTQFKVFGPTLTIGRGKDNDICIKEDSNISRKHVRISIHNGEIHITSLNEKNPLFIDRKPIKSAIIENGVRFVAGRTLFEIGKESRALQKKDNISHQGSYSNPPSLHQGSQNAHPPSLHQDPSLSPPPSPAKKKNPVRIILYSIVAMAVLFLVFGSKKKDEVERPGLRTEEKIDEELKDIKKIIDDLKKRRKKSGRLTSQFRRAQVGYLKGFRDYKQGQYEKAIRYFQQCLSINPTHILCNRYLNLSQKRFNELIQYHMIVGKKSLDKKQYRSCMKSFKNVMFMVKDQSHKVFVEAKSNYDICEHHDKDRF